MTDNKTKARRTCLRSDITRSYNKIAENPESMSVDDCKSLHRRLSELQKELNNLDSKIFDNVLETLDDASAEAEYIGAEDYKAKLFLCLDKLNLRINPPNATAPAALDARSGDLVTERFSKNKLRLPQIPLPTYAHKEGEDLNKFFLNLENILNKYGLTDYETFIFLQGQLSGEPLSLVKSLDVGSQSYAVAKELLTRAFASVITQQFDTIKRMADLKFTAKTPYEYIGKVRQIREAFGTLNINTDIVLQYWVWNSMPEMLQNQFVTLCNLNRPNLAQIDQFIFDAMERYLEIQKRNSKQASSSLEVSSYAVNMDTFKKHDADSKQFCSLCSTRDNKVSTHSTFSCAVYPSTKDKLAKLKSMNGCDKCGNVTHSGNYCKFKFKRSCMHCNKYHFSFLCPNASNGNAHRNEGQNKPKPNLPKKDQNYGKPNSKKQNTEAKCTWINGITFDNTGQDSVLPTFTFTIGNENVRAMRDSGCQSCFITRKLADKMRLKVLKDKFELGINGINSSKKVMTTVVELPIFDNMPPISAVCLPEIRTALHLPGLRNVAQEFSDRGYKLADAMLLECGDTIANIDVIIGDNEAQLLPQTDVTFGGPAASVYAETPAGIMLLGSIERMLNNIDSLPIKPSLERGYISKQPSPERGGYISDQPSLERGGFISDQPSLERCYISDDLTALAGNVSETVPAINAPIEQQFDVIDAEGNVDETILQRALDAAVKYNVDDVLSYDKNNYEEGFVELDKSLVDHVVRGTTREADGRLKMPLMWNAGVSDRLANNFFLAKAILKSNFAKLCKSPGKLKLYDDVIKDQERNGVIRRVDDISTYMREHATCSFLPHMGVYRMGHESTKCRVVYLSNLADRKHQKSAVSHNQAILSGPCLNKKICTAVCDLRFDRYLLCFDIVKAFLNISLYEEDQEKLLFLWYRNVAKNDFTLVAYKNTRLPFGIRCSPATLSVAMHIMLISDAQNDDSDLRNLKRLIYSLMYVDNGGVTANTSEELYWAYKQLNLIFNPYQFYIQQLCTNDLALQESIESDAEKAPVATKLFGMMWNRENDTISTQPLKLDRNATTKRMILSSIASNYDLFQITGPMLNRARTFMHVLQCDKDLGWDTKLKDDSLREWSNICKQVNNTPQVEIRRSMGSRDSTYNLIACTDASKTMYGTVLYLQNTTDNTMSFLVAKNRIVNKQLESKSIPCLEFHAIGFGVELLHEYRNELCGNKTVTPIKIVSLKLLSDSMVSLNWLHAACLKIDKLQKVTPFVKNRLAKIVNLCDDYPVEFGFISGSKNPADCITRCLSHKQLVKSNYFVGPELSETNEIENPLQFVIPTTHSVECNVNAAIVEPRCNLVKFERFSSLKKLFNVYKLVYSFINILKRKRNERVGGNLEVETESTLRDKTWKLLLCADQSEHYANVIKWLREHKPQPNNALPPIMAQLNVFLDDDLIRVQSKFDRWADHAKYNYPVLLAKDSKLTALIVSDIHSKRGHAGIYSVLNELRKNYYVPNHFSIVKRVLRECVHCRRMNGRTIKVTQNSYRDFRVSPPNVPFRYIFIDHFGPYMVKNNGKKVKVWVLLFSCLWSRATNLKMCTDLTVAEFLKCVQLHIFEFGTPERVMSDQGSQIISGGNVISSMMNNHEVTNFLHENGIKPTSFAQYAKGCHELGGLVESCVKIAKRMIHGCIGNQVLDMGDFNFIVCQTTCLVNKRPIAFREALRDNRSNLLPTPITPETLLRGHDLVTLDILPNHSVDVDPDWNPTKDKLTHIRNSYEKLNKNRKKLSDIYRDEFIADLTRQATNTKQRYASVKHEKLEKGDLVLLKEQHTKCIHFPMAIVQEVTSNSLGEVTDAIVRKGNRENVKRHVNSMILLLKNEISPTNQPSCIRDLPVSIDTPDAHANRPKRTAATRCIGRMASLANQNLV